MTLNSYSAWGLLVFVLLGACTNIDPGAAPTVELEERYQTQSAPPVTLSPEQKASVQNVVRLKLKNPDTAQFGFMNATQGEGGIANICGWVNEKNYLGRWERYRPFYVKYFPAGQRIRSQTGQDSMPGQRCPFITATQQHLAAIRASGRILGRLQETFYQPAPKHRPLDQ